MACRVSQCMELGGVRSLIGWRVNLSAELLRWGLMACSVCWGVKSLAWIAWGTWGVGAWGSEVRGMRSLEPCRVYGVWR